MIIGIIYKIVLFLTLFKSFILGRKYFFSTQNYLFVYLLITCINEWVSFIRNCIDPHVKVGLQYNLYFIFCILFFFFYFIKNFTNSTKKISFISSILSLGFVIIKTNFSGENFDKNIGIAVTLFYITNSLLWFYQKISFFDEHKITDDPSFWISTSLLMWSCFFLFRVTPMFYFAKEDKEFLEFLKVGQNIINIVMYIMFYISLKKYEKLSYGSYTK